MNRVLFTVIQQKTSLNVKQLTNLNKVRPNLYAFQSQKFPIYPIEIIIFLQNPPFNKFSIIFQQYYYPSKLIVSSSDNLKSFMKLFQTNDFQSRKGIFTIVLKQNCLSQYIKLTLIQPSPHQKNICKQLKIKGIQFSFISFFNTRFVCNLQQRLLYHPIIFKNLQILEYKYLLLHNQKNNLYQKYQHRLHQFYNNISIGKIDKLNPTEKDIQIIKKQIVFLQSQIIYDQEQFYNIDPLQTKQKIKKLQNQINQLQIQRCKSVKNNVRDYFRDYSPPIHQQFLKLLSSSANQDHNKALIRFWSQIKSQQLNPIMQQAAIIFLNYFFQTNNNQLHALSIKTFLLFLKKPTKNKNLQINSAYQRALLNIFTFIHQKQDNQLFKLSLKCGYLLYDKIQNKQYLQILLKSFESYQLQQQIIKLQILQKVCLRGIHIEQRKQVVQFLLSLLLNNKLSLVQKNKAYNVAAYLATIYGKNVIIKDFQKLNAMILMTMQKNIDNKMAKMQNIALKQNNQQNNNCQYCGKLDKNFKEQNLYNLHLAKECPYITACEYCKQNVQIPQLFKHRIDQCTNKNIFKHCDNCFDVILIQQQQKHNKKCIKKMATRCPLCLQKVQNKLQLKHHLLVQKCPNNNR